MHPLHFAVYLILTGIRVCDSFEPTTHSGHPVIIESGFHPCVDSINYAYLAFQGHCQRVTHSFRNVGHVKDNNADLIAVTETWLRPEDTEGFISSITPPGYKFTHIP